MLFELEFGKLYQFMSKNSITRMEKNEFMGKDDKLPTRLFIDLFPDEVYEQRVRKTKAYNRKKGTIQALSILTDQISTCL